jgi:hypothetical protein
LRLTDKGPVRYTMRSGPEVTLLQRLGLVAPQKPEYPPAPCPPAFDVRTLSQDEQDVLYGYPEVQVDAP